MDKPIITIKEVFNCARCGTSHEDINFYPLTNNPVRCDGRDFTHFAMCPALGEPILMARTDETQLVEPFIRVEGKYAEKKETPPAP